MKGAVLDRFFFKPLKLAFKYKLFNYNAFLLIKSDTWPVLCAGILLVQ